MRVYAHVFVVVLCLVAGCTCKRLGTQGAYVNIAGKSSYVGTCSACGASLQEHYGEGKFFSTMPCTCGATCPARCTCAF